MLLCTKNSPAVDAPKQRHNSELPGPIIKEALHVQYSASHTVARTVHAQHCRAIEDNPLIAKAPTVQTLRQNLLSKDYNFQL